MTHIQIIDKLVGPLSPVGESNEDKERLLNLSTYLDIIEDMVFRVSTLADYRLRYEHSVKTIGELADNFLRIKIREYLPEQKE